MRTAVTISEDTGGTSA